MNRHPCFAALTVFSAMVLTSAPAALGNVAIGSTSPCASPPPQQSGPNPDYVPIAIGIGGKNCEAEAIAAVGAGLIKLKATAAMHTSVPDSAFVSATSSGGFGESARVIFRNGGDRVAFAKLQPILKADGSVAASGSEGTGASASISYSFTWGSFTLQGTKKNTHGIGEEVVGSFGSAVRLPPVVHPKNHQFGMSYGAEVSALVNHGFAPNVSFNGTASADFSSTLQVMGVEVLEVFDASMQSIPIPPGFGVEVVGDVTGVDYAQPVPTEAPTVALHANFRILLPALGLVGAIVRRRRRG